jgi:CoA:oxalate CoA-transferase
VAELTNLDHREDTALLHGITVVEAPGGIATPYCGRLLADLGARVITVEPPGGSALRTEGPHRDDWPHPAYGGLFAYLNRGKHSVTLNLATDDGARLLEHLTSHADVLLEETAGEAVDDVRPRAERLRRANPALIVTSISPFGLTGPRRAWQATPLTLFALSSRMRVHGTPERMPLQYAPDMVPCQAGATAAAAIGLALVNRDVTGAGALVEVSVLESLIANVDVITLLTSFTGVLNKRGVYPPLTYPCKDGFIILSFQDRAIAGIKAAINDPEVLADPRFAGRHAVSQHQDDFDAVLLPWLLDHNRDELFTILQANHVMCSPVFDFLDVLANPHYTARRFFEQVDDPVLGLSVLPGSVFAPGCRTACEAPQTPGAHNQLVYEGMLGVAPATAARLRAAGVI